MYFCCTSWGIIMEVKTYKKDFEYSYTLGAFPTIELLKTHPEAVCLVYIHSGYTDSATIYKLAQSHGISVEVNDKMINKLSDKENCFVIAVFNKFSTKLSKDSDHVVLVNPSNMGNMGTIMRTAVAFSIKNLAIISPGVDIFNPKTIRASMGALFRLNVQYFDSFEEYKKLFPDHNSYCFMLNASKQLTVNDMEIVKPFSLVFGNEATGLPDSFLNEGTSIIIPESDEVDSLNITIAAGIGMFMFTR